MVYTPTAWRAGQSPGISADRLLNLEQGVADAHRMNGHATGRDELGYDDAGRLTLVRELDPDGAEVSVTALAYDDAGRLTGVTETLGGRTITTTLTYTSSGALAAAARTVA